MPILRKKHRHREPENPGEGISRQVFLGVGVILLISLLGVAVWYVTRLSFVTIRSIDVHGGETISADEIKNVVEAELEGSYLRLIPYSFSYTYPATRVHAALASIPRIKEVRVEKEGQTSLVVHFREHRPSALWCLSLDENAPCYFLDSEGYAFDIAPTLRGGTFIRHVVQGKTELVELQLFSPEIFTEISTFLASLETELSLRVTSISHTKEGDSTYHITGGGDLLTTTALQGEAVMTNLRALLESKEFKHLTPGNFNYIDLRFGKKVFVNEEMEPVATTTDDSL